jgi:hypothetical protein
MVGHRALGARCRGQLAVGRRPRACASTSRARRSPFRVRCRVRVCDVNRRGLIPCLPPPRRSPTTTLACQTKLIPYGQRVTQTKELVGCANCRRPVLEAEAEGLVWRTAGSASTLQHRETPELRDDRRSEQVSRATRRAGATRGGRARRPEQQRRLTWGEPSCLRREQARPVELYTCCGRQTSPGRRPRTLAPFQA